MENKKEDLRIRRTHKLLRDALFALLETKSFDEISVVDICDKAMVHRATFYKHFKDKYEFMEYAAKEKIREFYEMIIAHEDFSDLNDIYRALIRNVMLFIEDNKQMFKISVSATENTFFNSIQKIISEELLEFLQFTNRDRKMTLPPDIITHFLTGGLTVLLRWWIANDTGYTKEEMAKHIEDILIRSHIDR